MFAFSRILLLLIVVCATTLSHANAKETTVILLFGDSIIAGYGLGKEETVPARLQAILQKNVKDIVVINGGVSGDTTGAGRSRLEWMLDKHRPDGVLLALGGNDLLRGLPPQVTRENINAMLDILKQRNIPTILSVVQAPDNLGEDFRIRFNAIYTDAAKTYGVPLYPFLLSETFGKNELMQADGVHPNAAGAQHIADSLAKYFKQWAPIKWRMQK